MGAEGPRSWRLGCDPTGGRLYSTSPHQPCLRPTASVEEGGNSAPGPGEGYLCASGFKFTQ